MNPREFLEKRIPKKTLLVWVLVIIASSVVIKFAFEYLNPIESRELSGIILSIDGDDMIVKGNYTVDGREDEFYQPDRLVSIEVKIGPETQIVKTIVTMPTAEELKATNGYWNPADLKREDMPSSLEELKKIGFANRPVVVITESNMFNKKSVTAKKISYLKQYYPDIPTSTR